MTQESPNKPVEDASPRQVQIKASDEALRGLYSNMANVLHTQEEFVIDFLNVSPPTGTLNALIILNPGHFKRLLVAMTDNLGKYEAQFGNVTPSEGPTNKIGFEA